jgi:hypothetical protein
VVAIASGTWHGVAAKSDGTVVAWGSNGWLQTNVPAGLTGVVAVAAGQRHSVALKSDGTVVAWGDNTWGEATPPAWLNSGIMAIAAGYYHTLVLKSNGTVVAWGNWAYDLTTAPAGLSNVVAIGSGAYQNLAITAKLRIDSADLSGQSPVIGFHSFAGQKYSLEYSTDLSLDTWSSLPNGTIPGTGQEALVTDTDALADAPARFYRVKLVR